MANKNGMIWKIVGTIITGIVLAAGIVAGYTTLGHQVEDNKEDIGKALPVIAKVQLDMVRCEGEREDMGGDIQGLEADIDKLGTKVDKFRDEIIKEQKAGFREILDKLDK